MRLLEKYILSEFFKLLAIATFAFILLFILVDLFENMDNLLKHDVPFLAGLVFFLYKIPFIISQISPVAVLVSVLLSLGLLAKHGEVTAMKAGGIRLLRAITPLLLIGLLISASVILMNEYVTPAAMKKADSFRSQWFGERGSTFGQTGMWLRSSQGIFNIRQVDVKSKQLFGVVFYGIEKPFGVKSRVQARTLYWQDEKWIAPAATVWSFTEYGEAESSEVTNFVLEGLVEPEDLVNIENIQKNMSFKELRDYIHGLEADGYDATRYKVDLYGKISFPLVNFIMVLLGVPFALKTGRHSGIAAGVGISVVIAFSYWIIFALTRSLSQTGAVPPIIAALFPDALFFAIGALMFGYVRE